MHDNSSNPQSPSHPVTSPSPDPPGNSQKRFRRKRGAPFGNQNARKHGLYSKFLTPDRIEKLDEAVEINDLSKEIGIVRLKLDSLLSDPNASTNEVLKTISILSKLIATQRRHFPADSHPTFTPAIMELIQELYPHFSETIQSLDSPPSQA